LLPPPTSPLFPYTTLFRSLAFLGAVDEALTLWRALYASRLPVPSLHEFHIFGDLSVSAICHQMEGPDISCDRPPGKYVPRGLPRSEEHTSELQSLRHLVCR